MSEVDTIQQKFLDSFNRVFGEATTRIIKKMFVPALIIGGVTYAEEVLLEFMSRNNYSVGDAEIIGSLIRGVSYTSKFAYLFAGSFD